jgi:alpha-ribazole phosphatase
MEIYLVRHTTPDVAKEVCYGQSDIPLATSFEKEAEKVLKHLPDKIDDVYTSPLARCMQLAERIGSGQIIEVPQLKEMHFGNWELQPWSAIPQQELNPWMEDFVSQQVPNGESMQMLAGRVISWYNQLTFRPETRIVIITHAGPIRVILSHVNQTPLQEAFKHYAVDYGEVKQIQ